MNKTLAEIAELVGGQVHGDASVRITGLNGIREASPNELTFVRDARYAPLLAESQAGAVLIAVLPEYCTIPAIITPMPDLAFARLLQECEFEQLQHPPVGVHPSAVLGEGVTLGEGVRIDAFVRIADGAQIAAGAILYAGVYIGRNAQIGADTILYPNAVVREECTIGAQCILHANSTIGTDGFGFAPLGGRWAKIPQVGRVVIEDDCEIGSNTTIDRATFGVTRVRRGTKIDNQVQIGHNADIGEDCAIAGMAGIAGSAVIKNSVRIGAQAGVNGHITIGEGATIAARGGATGSVDPGKIVSGFPALDHKEARRVQVAQVRVPELIRRVKQLERQLAALEGTLHAQATDHSE
jgi:UDP-3-O-[3-hydroxymyristoyl] glucosamine N-acyltransferase